MLSQTSGLAHRHMGDGTNPGLFPMAHMLNNMDDLKVSLLSARTDSRPSSVEYQLLSLQWL